MTQAKTVAKENAPRPHVALIAQLRDQAALESSLGSNANIGFELAAKAIDAIAVAETLDDIFAANEASTLPGVESVDGRPFTIIDMSFTKAREEFSKGGVGTYVHCNVMFDGGDLHEFTVGAPNVVASLFQIQRLGLMGEDSGPRIVIKGTGATNGTLYKVYKP